MVFSWAVTDTIFASEHGGLTSVSGLVTYAIGDQWYVAISSMGSDTLYGFQLDATGILTETTDTGPSTNGTTTGLTYLETETGQWALSLSRWSNTAATYALSAGGEMTRAHSRTTSWSAQLEHAALAPGLDQNLIVYSQMGVAGLSVMRLLDTGALRYMGHLTGADLPLDHVSEIVALETNSATVIFASSDTDHAVSSYILRPDGSLRPRHNFETGGDFAINTPSAMATAHLGGRDFLIVASSGSDSLHVLRIKHRGGLVETDQVRDTGVTRFEGANTLDIAEIGGRVLVMVSGREDGLSLFELSPAGTLLFLTSIADTYSTALGGIADMELIETETGAFLIIGGQDDSGLSVIELSLPSRANTVIGTHLPETLNGTHGADYLSGKGGRDTLFGRNGDDHLFDGHARDVLTGGGGADVFEFAQDGVKDTITDFQQGQDVIDLSNYNRLYGIDQLSFLDYATGVKVMIGGEKLIVQSANQMPLTLTEDDFIFL